MSRRPLPGLPWADGDALSWLATSALGLVAIVVGWFGASGTALLPRQSAWLSVGVIGAVVAALGNCVWLLRGRCAVGERRRQLVALTPVSPTAGAVSPTAPAAALVRVDGMTRVHRPECPLVVGKDARAAAPADGDACGMCLS